jgi:hypothetical protein
MTFQRFHRNRFRGTRTTPRLKVVVPLSLTTSH